MSVNGRTAIDGRSGSASAVAPPGSGGRCSRTSPTKRTPLRAIVRMVCWRSPLSPTARRSELMRLVSVDSDTIRPPQTEAMRSSLLTTRSRFATRWTKRSKTCGSSGISSP